MAVPATMTTLDISGKYTQNKVLSDDTDDILRIQGVNFFTRKAVGLATLYITIKHTNEDGVEKINIKQVLTGGIGSAEETHVLDWTEKDAQNKLFGPTHNRVKRAKAEDLVDEFLSKGWAPTTLENGCINIHSESVANGWTVEAAWGIDELEGELRHVRHVLFTGPDGEQIRARMVFDYTGPESE